MTEEDLEVRIRLFDKMALKAAEGRSMIWCAKRSWPIWTASLKGRECLRCRHLIKNGGICDPL